MHTRRWEAWRSLIVCQVWAFTLFLPNLAELGTANNRYFSHWSAAALLLNLAAVTAFGLLLFALGALVRRLWPAYYGPVAGTAAVTTLIFLVQALLFEWFHYILPSRTCGCGGRSPLLFEWCRFHYILLILTPLGVGTSILIKVMLQRGLGIEWVRQRLSRIALFLSFLPPLFWLNCLTYTTYPRREYPAPKEVADRAAGGARFPADNVYVFVFDAWSRRLTFGEDGAVREGLPALREFAQEACVFSDCHSPGCHTVVSLPRLLFQRQEPYVLHKGQPGFWAEEQFLPCSQLPHLFSYARDAGFRTYMVGWHHPYFALVGDRCDYVYAVPSVQLVGDSLPARVGAIYWRWARGMTGPVLSIPLRCSEHLQVNHSYLWQNEELLRHAHDVLSDERPSGQFVVMHLPPPHPPFIYTREGAQDLNAHYDSTDATLASQQIAYLDQVIGGFLAGLRQRGKYDNSIIVLTSDHTWREDPQIAHTARALTHVPLFIRFPGQDQPVRVREPFSTSRLLALLEQVQMSQGRWRDLSPILAGQQWYHPVADEEVPFWSAQSR